MNTSIKKNIIAASPGILACAGLLLIVLIYGCHIVHHRTRHSRNNTTHSINVADEGSRTVSSDAPELRITELVQHGHILEIRGYSEPGAIVMINGEPAATIFDQNSFRHFVGPLSRGTTIITITSQTYQGGVSTEQLAFTIE
jgi:hypothetical protein